MIDTTVTVTCSEYCEAEFVVSLIGLPPDLRGIVQRQAEQRGWEGVIPGRMICPLHR